MPDCPACNSYSLTLNTLSKKYKPRNIRFIGVVPGNFATADEIKQFVKDYNIRYPVVTDTSNRLVRCLGATKVPEAFLVDAKGITLYAGRIDDWMVSLGKKRQVITAFDLENAIKDMLANKPVRVSKTKAIGCIIE